MIDLNFPANLLYNFSTEFLRGFGKSFQKSNKNHIISLIICLIINQIIRTTHLNNMIQAIAQHDNGGNNKHDKTLDRFID